MLAIYQIVGTPNVPLLNQARSDLAGVTYEVPDSPHSSLRCDETEMCWDTEVPRCAMEKYLT